jgi:two-component system nitrogen regulation sensor histidine kinase GlnL
MLGPNRRPSYAPVNIHHVLERVRSLVLAETRDRIKIVRDYDPSIPQLIGDSDQLIQAVLNIVRNASRVLGDSGTVTLQTRIQRQLTIGNARYRLAAQINIIDDGPGIPPEIADTLFFPMVTAGTGGMGLGLSIAQSLINQHKGLIECTSRKGKTIFTIFLPLGDDISTARDKENNPSD